jgi:serine/threonine-protein kinase
MDMDVRPGVELAGHRILQVIGRGGVSVVYLAEHLRLNRKVALKILFRDLAADPDFRDRFIRESQVAASLDHPNVVTVYDAGEVDGLLFLSMRYVAGSDLRHVLSARSTLSPERAIGIVMQVASALDAAHGEGLVHRDVKPGNILLSGVDTAGERAYLSDFGITKQMSTRGGGTRTGQFVGTVDYVAPEQILAEHVDGRADVYALGCVLFESLSGRAPFARPTDVATIYAHLHDDTPHLSHEGVPGIDGVIQRALAKAKDDRYPTCTSLALAAEACLPVQERGPVSPPDGAGHERPTLSVGRSARRSLLGVVLVASIVAVGVAVSTVLADRRGGQAGPTSSVSHTEGPGRPDPSTRIDWRTLNTVRGGPGVVETATQTASGTVVAAGHSDDRDEDAAVWTSVGGVRWKQQKLPGVDPGQDERIWDIAARDDVVVAVGYDGGDAAAWSSSDGGASWRFTDGFAVTGLTRLRAIAVAPDGAFLAFGRHVDGAIDDGMLWRSTDGGVWSRVEAPAFEGDGIQAVSEVVTVGDTMVAVGSGTGPTGSIDAAAWESDGTAWKRVDPQIFAQSANQLFSDVAAVGDTVVAVGSQQDAFDADLSDSEAVAWVRDGSGTWSEARLSPENGPSSLGAVISAQDRYFLAAGWATKKSEGQNAAVWASIDGDTWTRQPSTVKTQQLEGPGSQAIRALELFEEKHRVLAFGEGESGAELWTGGLRS